MNKVIKDHIDRGHFDRDLGAMVRDPQYSDCTAGTLRAILEGQITDNMLPEHCYGLGGVLKVLAVILGALLAIAVMGGMAV